MLASVICHGDLGVLCGINGDHQVYHSPSLLEVFPCVTLQVSLNIILNRDVKYGDSLFFNTPSPPPPGNSMNLNHPPLPHPRQILE